MTTQEEIARRFDQQDAALHKILEGMAEHRAAHSITDPGIQEVVSLLQGAKAVKAVARWAIAIVVAAAATWAWLADHARLFK